ncbi:MAG: malate dehydrogenase [Bacteroidetes bacterium]|nr:malate dehydrogenase [Bacteroidota bacterium]
MKISIVGAGNVGAVTAQRIMTLELATEVVLLDRMGDIARGKALDIYESAPLVRSDCRVAGTADYQQTANSDIVVVTAGISRQPGMTRDDRLARNAEIVRDVTRRITALSQECIVIVVSSPIEEMTHVALHASGFARERVIGMAGVLNASRLRTFIAMELNVAVEDVEATVLGGHGDDMIPMLRYASVAGVPVVQLLTQERMDALASRARTAGVEIINLLKTGSAFYAPSAAVCAMIEAIVRNKPRIMPCAVRLDGEYGERGVVMGVPIRIARPGMMGVVELELLEEERAHFHHTADMIRENLARLPD